MDFQTPSHSFSFTSFKRIRLVIPFATISILLLIYSLSTERYPSTSVAHGFSRGHAAASDDTEYVAMCVAHRNQVEDLPEFLRHHYYQHGIRRFYIMDDQSSPPLSSLTTSWGIPRSALSFQHYDATAQHPGMQFHIYDECARLYGTQHTWMAFLDADEFLEVLDPNENLLSILHELEQDTRVGALGMNWRLHSSAGLLTRPESVRKAFTQCVADPEVAVTALDALPRFKDNRLIKSVVRTAVYLSSTTAHYFKTGNGTYTVGEHGDVVEDGIGIRQPITRERLAVHHYTVKSREQYVEKMGNWVNDKGWTYWDHIEGLSQEECLEMTRYEEP